MIVFRTASILLLNAWLSAFGANFPIAPETWIATNTVGGQESPSNYFECINLTPSLSADVPNFNDFSNNSYRVLLKVHEPVIARGQSKADLRGKIVAIYDVRSLRITNVFGMNQPRDPTMCALRAFGCTNFDGMTHYELNCLWHANQSLLKASYFRGRIFYNDSDSFSVGWMTAFASEDKRRLVIAADSGPIIFSENSGVSWTSINQPGRYEFTLATSPKGSAIVAALSFGNLPIEKIGTNNWYSVVSGADGSKLVLTGGPSQSAPVLSIAASGNNVLLSWPSSFTGFILQQNSDLTTANWVNVTNAVDTIDGQFVVTLPLADGNNFFRLKTP
jgi:hypothetical protein